ncbi:putative isomerase YbhE [Rhizodiscina lignyota]|uniref:Isomerase YbhE n=1 Tax=Rhizodiscina lignyota TaxID=1504668 RepID=A0A9P4ID60_9PEZI|nr:putative isomerase YbhE [Rhizodiscina lignyota]
MDTLLIASIALMGVVGAVSYPDCQAVAPHQKTLNDVRTANISAPASPFGLIFSKQSDRAFVALNTTLGVLDTSSLKPKLMHQIPVPAEYLDPSGVKAISLTHDGRYVIASTYIGAVIVNVEKAVVGSSDAFAGALVGTAGNSSMQVTITADDKYAIVSQEYGISDGIGALEVFKLHEPTGYGSGNVTSTYVGALFLGRAVLGTALSSDGRTLYATSELAVTDTQIGANGSARGNLSVIDVETLKTDPSKALLHNVPAGCDPVRVSVAPDSSVWVTARQSNHLLAYDAKKLLSQPEKALIASVQVGTAPVGLIFVSSKHGSRILTADSNRFDQLTTTGISVVDWRAALRGKPAGLGKIPTGLFPREFAISPDGRTVLVADFDSSQVQAIDVDSLP